MSATNEGMRTKYWLTACSSFLKKCECYSASRFYVTSVLVDYSLMMILTEEEITEMNLDTDHVINFNQIKVFI